MQVEKHLFRIAEKANKSSHASLCWSAIHYLALIIGLASLVALMIGQIFVKPNLHSLENCFSDTNFRIKGDEVGIVFQSDSTQIKQLISKQKPINQSKQLICSIYKNLNTSLISQQNQITLTSIYTTFKMQAKQRSNLKFDNYTIILHNRHKLLELIYSSSVLLATQLINLADKKQLSKIFQKTQFYFKSFDLRVHYDQDQLQSHQFTHTLFGFFQVVFSYAVSSIITSAYIYATIIASPAFILLVLKVTPYGRTESFFEAFKAFPWIGIHSLIFRASNKPVVRFAFDAVCFSLIKYFFVMYLGYYLIIVQVTNLFFKQPMQNGVGEVLFGYFAIVEFACLIFMRTKPFLKYFPLINTFSIFLFMIYCFKFLGVISMQFLGISFFAWLILKLEIPAQNEWDPQLEYVPNIKQPRAGLMPAFNLNWINSLPDQWAMLMPVMSRQKFVQRQLSLVDQNYDQLSQYLNGNRN